MYTRVPRSAARSRKGLVGGLVLQHGPAVADDDGVEGVQERGGVPGMAQGQVELLAQP
ncbi:hypothetical protein RKD37_000882 [Streptomyces ambofaciens]